MIIFDAVFDGEPVPKGRARFNRRSGRVYTPATTRDAEVRLRRQMKESYGSLPHAGEIAVILWFASGGHGDDIDNLEKLVMDAANHVIWEDDRQVVAVNTRLFRYQRSPHTRMRVASIGEPLTEAVMRKARRLARAS